MSTRILIAGCGYIGTRLGAQLAAGGARVWGLRRSPADLPRGIEQLQADLLRPDTLAALPPNLDVVFYTAAAGGGDPAQYEAIYRTGVAHLLEALQAQQQTPRRILFTSSTGVYGQSDGSWVDESSATEPARAGSRHILAGERLLFESPLPATVVRLSGIYGPSRTRLIDQVRRGDARRRPGPASWTNRIHRDDCAGILAHVAQLAHPDNVYVGSDSAPVAYNDVLVWLAQRLGVPEPPIEPQRDDAVHRAPGINKRCSNARILATSYRFRFPSYREGYGALLEDSA